MSRSGAADRARNFETFGRFLWELLMGNAAMVAQNWPLSGSTRTPWGTPAPTPQHTAPSPPKPPTQLWFDNRPPLHAASPPFSCQPGVTNPWVKQEKPLTPTQNSLSSQTVNNAGQPNSKGFATTFCPNEAPPDTQWNSQPNSGKPWNASNPSQTAAIFPPNPYSQPIHSYGPGIIPPQPQINTPYDKGLTNLLLKVQFPTTSTVWEIPIP